MITTDKISYPKITIITVVRNSEETIATTIKSVLAQNYPSLEYIVLDGNSEDNTLPIIQQYIDHIDIHVSEPDQGIYDAMNKASDLASGVWILYMNAGDRFHSPDSLTKLTQVLRSDADVIFAGVEEVLVDSLGIRIFHKMPHSIENIWYQMPTSHQSTIVRLLVQRKYRFDTQYKWCADHDMLARMYRDNKTFICRDVLLCTFDCLSNGTHRNSQLYIRERWQLSQGLVPLHKRLFRYSMEWIHCKVWGQVVKTIKPSLSNSVILKLRKLRGTSGIRSA